MSTFRYQSEGGATTQLLDKTALILDEEKLERMSYPKKEELAFINGYGQFNNVNYKNFINERKNYLIKEFKEKVLKD